LSGFTAAGTVAEFPACGGITAFPFQILLNKKNECTINASAKLEEK
jgi:hypothetical protein